MRFAAPLLIPLLLLVLVGCGADVLDTSAPRQFLGEEADLAQAGGVTVSIAPPEVAARALSDRFVFDDVLVQVRLAADNTVLREAVLTLANPSVSFGGFPAGTKVYASAQLRRGGTVFAQGRSKDVTIAAGKNVSAAIVVEATVPTIGNKSPLDGEVVATSAPTIYARVTDPGGKNPSSTVVLDGVNLGTFAGTEVSVPTSGLATGSHTVELSATTVSGGSALATWTFVVDPAANVTAPWDQWVGKVQTFYKATGSLAYTATLLTVATPPSAAQGEVSLFFFNGDLNLECRGALYLTDQGLVGGELGWYDNTNVFHTYPAGQWSSGPWLYDDHGDLDPTTGTVTVPNVSIDIDGDGAPEYTGTVTLAQTASTPF
ncbi:MAG TPA: hypothetical protein PLC05_00735 [bacterium]|nr:hypothetical protein [bacterium]HOR57160.1 hypothetical protein [bacterium]HPL56018.1 hypothetical protein [bacterium]